MYLHIYQCKNCKAFSTENCTWKDAKENNVACVDFEPVISTTSTTGTSPISEFGLDLPNTYTSASGPVEITIKKPPYSEHQLSK